MHSSSGDTSSNRHVVGEAGTLQERRQRLHPGLESCAVHREVRSEALTEVPVGQAIELRKADGPGCRLRSVGGRQYGQLRYREWRSGPEAELELKDSARVFRFLLIAITGEKGAGAR